MRCGCSGGCRSRSHLAAPRPARSSRPPRHQAKTSRAPQVLPTHGPWALDCLERVRQADRCARDIARRRKGIRDAIGAERVYLGEPWPQIRAILKKCGIDRVIVIPGPGAWRFGADFSGVVHRRTPAAPLPAPQPVTRGGLALKPVAPAQPALIGKWSGWHSQIFPWHRRRPEADQSARLTAP